MIKRELTTAEVDAVTHRHAYHKPATPDVAANHEAIREIIKNAELECLRLIPAGRPASMFSTKMDEARMWANMALATAPTFGT